ncbi:uncharacterized protein [Anser cygnoides]|uniref:uncharacterized protein isoform X1 n=1 Tax=Anser cygnoides TaxID=8845 RepID=UPI0034D2B5F1
MKHMLLDTVLLFLLLSDAAGGQDSCDALQRGDRIEECCNITVEPEERNEAPGLPLDLPRHCAELRRSSRPACRCLQARWLRLVQMAGPALSGTDGLQALHLNVSRGLAHDLLLSFSPAQGPMTISSMEEGKAGKIRLPREVFQSLSSQTAHMVVTVLNIQQLGMFEEDNQMGQVLDDTVVGIMVEDLYVSGLQDPVHLTFAHQQLPPVSWMCPPSPCLSTEAQAHTTLLFAECHPTVCLLGAQQRAGRWLEHQRMCHTAWGQGDSLFLQPPHLLHPPPGDNPIPYSSCFYPGYAASPSLSYLVPQVSPLAAQRQSFLLPGKPRPFLKTTFNPSFMPFPFRQAHISRGCKGWKRTDSGSTETQGPFPHLVPTPRERLHLLRSAPTSTLPGDLRERPEGSGLVRSCSTSPGVLLLCCRTPLSPVVLAAVARFSRLVWTHLTQGACVWQNPALNTSMVQTLVAVANTGCGVAVAFSIFTIAFYIFLRCSYQQFRSEETLRTNLGLHMNLVSSLLLLNLAFLLNNGVSSRAMPGLCSALGGLTHYCLLCCFTWTALEGSHLYLLFVKVLGTYIHHYLAKLCLVGWGFPALVVVVAGAMGSYGEYSIRMTDQQTVVHLCWINSEHLLVHYITNCGYFSLVFLFNTAIFGVVAWKNCHLWSTGMVQGRCKAWRVALAVVGLFCLLGATWALAFLSYGSSSVPILYLSTILNSLQGLFIFIWLVVLYYPKMEETTNSLSHIIRNDRTVAGSQG